MVVEHTKDEYERGIKCLYDKLPNEFTDNVQYPDNVECKKECSLVQLSLLGAFIERLCHDRRDLLQFVCDVKENTDVDFCKCLTIDCKDDCKRCEDIKEHQKKNKT
jgi:hypothetical protein